MINSRRKISESRFKPHLICTKCGNILERNNESILCKCGKNYKVKSGIILFTDKCSNDDSIEPQYWDKAEKAWQMPFVDAGITAFLNRFLPYGATVLDIGCGTGIRFVKRISDFTAGIDLSPKRLALAANIYDEVSLASAENIPYQDSSFDAVISVDVMEHIPAEYKDDAIREMLRILKQGGIMIHILDLDSDKPLHKWAKKYPKLYRKYFIEQMGHYGLETADAVIKRFSKFNLELLKIKATNRTFLQLPENYAWQFDNEYCRESFCVRLLVSISYRIRRWKILYYLYSAFYQLLWTTTIEKLFPINWSFNLAAAFRKKA